MQRFSPSRLFGAILLLLAALSGCRLDDDSSYEIRTFASIFLVEQPSGLLGLTRYDVDAHTLDMEWNEKAGVADADLSDAEIVDNLVWIASGPRKAVLQVRPTSGARVEAFENLPLAPHHLAVGAKQILICDTVSHQVAMIKRRNGEVQVLEYDQHPGACIYNSGKFYLVQNDTSLVILDETAMTSRGTFDLGMVVDELLLSRYKFPILMGHDTAGVRQALIDANGDFLVGGESYAVPYEQYRPTAYFAVRFGKEYLRDLRLHNRSITLDDLTLIADSVDRMEADFFEGTVYYLKKGHFVARDIATDALRDSIPFASIFRKSMHQYAAE